MATCARCGRRWRTLPGEEQDHPCACGYDPSSEPKPPVFEREIEEVESLLKRAEAMKQELPHKDDFCLIESSADILIRTLKRVQEEMA